MRSLCQMVLVCAFAVTCVMDSQAGDKKRDAKKPTVKKQQDAQKQADEKRKAADAQKAKARAQADAKKKQDAERAAALKKRQEELEKSRAEAKKRFEEEQKKRAAASAFSRRVHNLPRLYWDLDLDERQLTQIEALQKRLQDGLNANNDEQKKLFQRGQELRKESEALRVKFDGDAVRSLSADQRKIVEKRKAEIEAKRKAWEAKRAVAFKEAQKKREAQNRRDEAKKKR